MRRVVPLCTSVLIALESNPETIITSALWLLFAPAARISLRVVHLDADWSVECSRQYPGSPVQMIAPCPTPIAMLE